jgi:hypothetical protein
LERVSPSSVGEGRGYGWIGRLRQLGTLLLLLVRDRRDGVLVVMVLLYFVMRQWRGQCVLMIEKMMGLLR